MSYLRRARGSSSSPFMADVRRSASRPTRVMLQTSSHACVLSAIASTSMRSRCRKRPAIISDVGPREEAEP